MKYSDQPIIVKEWKIKGTKLPDIWTLQLWSDSRLQCDCPSFTFKNKHFCKHTQAKRFELEATFGNLGNYLKEIEKDEKLDN